MSKTENVCPDSVSEKEQEANSLLHGVGNNWFQLFSSQIFSFLSSMTGVFPVKTPL